jgi:hypothetical protein
MRPKKLACGGDQFPFVGRIAANFCLMEPSYPKTDYEKHPPSCDLLMRAANKHKIHHTDLQTTRIGGMSLPEVLLVAPSPLSTLSRTMMRRR